MAAEVIIDFILNSGALDSAIDQLEQLGQVDEETAKAFKKTNQELSNRANEAKKIGDAAKGPVKALDDLNKKTKKVSSDFQNEIEQGITDALNDLGVDIGDLRKQFEAMGIDVDALAKFLNKMADDTGEVVTSTGSLKRELKELNLQIAEAVARGENFGDKFDELVSRAGMLRDSLDEANAVIKNAASDTKNFDDLLGLTQTLAGGFAVVQGAAGLFGDESEDLQKTLLKVNSAMAVLQGLSQVQAAIQRDGAITLALLNAQQKVAVLQTNLETAAQSKNIIVKKAATAAQWALNAAMSANPIGILVTALAAVATALVIYTRNSRAAAEATGELRGAVKNLVDGLDETTAAINRNTEREIIDLERAGAKQSDIMKARLAAIQSTISANQEAYNRNKAILDKGLGDEEDREKLAEQLAATRINTINLRIEAQRLAWEIEKQILEEQKKRAAELLEAEKKRIQDAIFRLKEEQLQVDEGTLTYRRLEAAIVLLQGKYNALGASAAQASFELANAAKENELLLRDQSTAIDTTLNNIRKKGIDTTKALQGVVSGSLTITRQNIEDTRSAYEKFIEETIPKIQQGLMVLQDVGAGLSAISQERQANIQAEMDAERARVDALLEAGAISEKEAEQRQKRLDRLESIQRQKAARQAKQLAIFQAIISTAQAVVNALATPPAPVGIALAAVVGAIGAAQIAAISARPIPAFAKGKKDGYAGPGIVGEAGAELIEKNGRMYIATKPTLVHLAAADKVYSNAETKRMLPTVDKSAMKQVPGKEFDYSKIAASIPKPNNVSINIDKEFIKEAVASGLQTNLYFNRRYSSK